jgi:hypothetical protein
MKYLKTKNGRVKISIHAFGYLIVIDGHHIPESKYANTLRDVADMVWCRSKIDLYKQFNLGVE